MSKASFTPLRDVDQIVPKGGGLGGMTALKSVLEVVRSECEGLHPRWRVVRIVGNLIPSGTGLRLRPRLYRLGGLRIGSGTVLSGALHITGSGSPSECLRIGKNCYINEWVSFNLGGDIVLEDGVSVGMESLFITVTHAMGRPVFRAGKTECKSIRIGCGAWLGARVVILPGVTVGAGAVIGAGAVVTRDVPPNVLAAGVPARVIRALESL